MPDRGTPPYLGTQRQAEVRAFGERLRGLRLKAGLSEEQLALRAGLVRGTIVKKIELGNREPGLSAILKLCRALRVSPNALIGDMWREKKPGKDR